PMADIILEIARTEDRSLAAYAYIRCSGLYTSWAVRLQSSGRTGLQSDIEKSTRSASVLLFAAHRMAMAGGIQHDLDHYLDEALALAVIYDDLMTVSFRSTGHAISQEVADDMEVCGALSAS